MKKLIGILSLSAILFVQDSNASDVRGPLYKNSCVLSRATDTYELLLKPNEDTLITVRGDGDSDLDCTLFDYYGRVLVSDTDSSDICSLYIHPYIPLRTILHIKNYGVTNCYTLTVQ